MALSTYNELQASVAAWLHRTDLSNEIPTFIKLFETRFNKTARFVQQITSTTLSPTSGVYTLPSDFLSAKIVALDANGDRALIYVDPESWYQWSESGSTGKPSHFTVIGNSLYTYPLADSDYDIILHYYAKLASLSDTGSTNWLITNHPDVYLFGVLIEGADFVEDQEKSAFWRERYAESFDNLVNASQLKQYTGSLLVPQNDALLSGI